LLTLHILISGAWLGLAAAKLVLGLAVANSADPNLYGALYAATTVFNPTFPPLAIGTIVSGVQLSLGTRWGLVQYYWVVAKLGLSVAVIISAVRIGDRLAERSSLGPDDAMLAVGTAALPLVLLSGVHVLMLGVATVLSVYKPWGRIRLGRNRAVPVSLASGPPS
jgi:hypothetical protein